jgi:hypothetical protein
LSWKIGATSLVNVGVLDAVCAAAVLALSNSAPAITPSFLLAMIILPYLTVTLT